MLPEAVLFGAGTSCKDLSKTNNQRTVGALRSKKGTSGRTFDSVKQYVVKTRPTITFMENVPLIGQEYEFDGLQTSDKAFVVQSFEEEGFTVVFTDMHARERVAAKELIRAWFVIFNIPREVADSIGLEQMFFEVLNSLKTEPTPCEEFFLTAEKIEKEYPIRLAQAGAQAPEGGRELEEHARAYVLLSRLGVAARHQHLHRLFSSTRNGGRCLWRREVSSQESGVGLL